jgi:cation diffusion facilitator family transporter
MECNTDETDKTKVGIPNCCKLCHDFAPTVWVVFLVKFHSLLLDFLPYPTQSLISLPIFAFISWKSLGSGRSFVLHLFSFFFLLWSISSPIFSFSDRCFLVIFAKEFQANLFKARVRSVALVVGFVLFLAFANFKLKDAGISLFLFIGSICVTFGCKRSQSHLLNITFDLSSFLIVILIELATTHIIRRHSIGLFFALTIRPKLESQVKLTWTSEAKRLLSFFLINFIFMFVEMWVGFTTNSLGLLSDAFHMLCDNASLFYSAATALVSRQPQTDQFPYGFGRLELVTSFTNGILLLYISFNLLGEGISRLIDPPNIGKDYLILTSIVGLFVNLAGLCFTNDRSGQSVFLRSIFLHVMVDTLGSIAVILSSICIVNFGIFICDPICSGLISLSIFVTAIPLVSDIVDNLMLKASGDLESDRLNAFGHIYELKSWSVRDQIGIVTMKIGRTEIGEWNGSELSDICFYLSEKRIEDATIEIVV